MGRRLSLADSAEAIHHGGMVNPLTCSLSLHTKILWLLLAGMGVVSAAGLYTQGISLAQGTLPGIGFPVAAMLGVAWTYTYRRPDPRLAALAHMAAITLIFTMFAAILSYLIVAWDRPLIDAQLAAADAALGLEWLPAWHWLREHRIVYAALLIAYASNIPQVVFLFVTLNFLGRIRRAWELQWLFILVCLACLLGSGIWPAMGPFDYYDVRPDAPYLPVYRELRAGTLHLISHDKVQGIITFPSLHVAQAMIYVYAARGVRFLFPVLLGLNLIVLVSTPYIGGHYYADLWGGLAITAIAILAVRAMVASGFLPEDAQSSKDATVDSDQAKGD